MISGVLEVFLVFLRLGLTSFGGPVAHLGYFHDELIKRRRWLGESAYADLVALCQFLPGPASSQIGIAVGLHRAGLWGAAAAWLGFTLPSATLLILFGLGMNSLEGRVGAGFLHGLKLVAVPIVAQALWSMARKLCPDRIRALIAVMGAVIVTCLPFGFGQVLVIVLGGMAGRFFVKNATKLPHSPLATKLTRRFALSSLILFGVLLMLLPMLAQSSGLQALKLFDSFFRAGSLVFGGGHVVLPLLKSEVVTPGWVDANAFMAGYGAAQAIPGPLFAFSAYLGTVSKIPPAGITGALICLVAAFMPSFFLVFGTVPFWEQIRHHKGMRAAMHGINAAVVGLLLAAFYNPVWSSAILSPRDFALAIAGFFVLVFWKWPSWSVVLLTAGIAAFF